MYLSCLIRLGLQRTKIFRTLYRRYRASATYKTRLGSCDTRTACLNPRPSTLTPLRSCDTRACCKEKEQQCDHVVDWSSDG